MVQERLSDRIDEVCELYNHLGEKITLAGFQIDPENETLTLRTLNKSDKEEVEKLWKAQTAPVKDAVSKLLIVQVDTEWVGNAS